MTPAPVRVAVIGVGAMGSRWARALAEHPGAEVGVVCDVREDEGRALANELSARVVADPREAAADPGVDAVAVCTPEHLHLEPALAALDADKAVMVEKPLADTVEGSETIRDHAAARGVPLLVGHILRFEPRYAAAHDAIAAGTIGAVSLRSRSTTAYTSSTSRAGTPVTSSASMPSAAAVCFGRTGTRSRTSIPRPCGSGAARTGPRRSAGHSRRGRPATASAE